MRRIILIFIYIFFIYNSVDAAIVAQIPSQIGNAQCTWALVNRIYYVAWNTYSNYLIDEIWSPTDRYIASSTSTISFWESDNNLISGCRTSNDWVRQSEVAPWNNTHVVAFWANCTFNKPTDLNRRNVQFVYNIKHWQITTNWTSSFTKNYATYEPASQVWSTFTKNYNNYFVENYVINQNECFNIELRYCWDWIRDLWYWEACDYNDINHIGWWVWWCSNTCTPINIPGWSTCNSLSASPSSSSAWSLNSTLTCSWNNVSNYQIVCWNGQVFSWTWTNSWTQTFSNVCNYNAIWNYTSVCTINNAITNPACNAVVSVTGWGGGWWGWWWGPACLSLAFWTWTWTYIATWIKVSAPNFNPDITHRNVSYTWPATEISIPVTCKWTSPFDYAKVNCWTSSITWTTPIKQLNSSNEYTFICRYNSIPNIWINPDYNPKCYIWSSSSFAETTSLSCWWKISFWPSFCWDWILQKPNSAWVNEQCDYWSANWNFTLQCNTLKTDVQCDSNCKIPQTTCPYNWSMIIWPEDNIIIWDWVNPFYQILTRPYVKNNSSFDLDLNALCTVHTSGTSLDWISPQCRNIWLLTPWEQKSFSAYPIFTSNIDNITAWSYNDNILQTTLKSDAWDILTNAYFAADFKVRVSRPSIATLWGWTSFVSNSNNIANVQKVADENRENIYWKWKNNNFVWVWISYSYTWPWIGLSSSSINISDLVYIGKIADQWTKNNTSINSVITSVWTNDWFSTTDINDFENFNWLDNVFILKNQDFEINSTNNNGFWSWPRTYIIENWNLIIKANIDYLDNIAFVVKWWDIKIYDSVLNITWTYIVIPKSWVGWKIIWEWWKTQNVLTIKWSIYWNINDLVSKRVYIKENTSWQLDVWTIVSFGSSIFRKPAPLTWQFLWEYIESQKIAK